MASGGGATARHFRPSTASHRRQSALTGAGDPITRARHCSSSGPAGISRAVVFRDTVHAGSNDANSPHFAERCKDVVLPVRIIRYMPRIGDWRTIEVMVTVKAYPSVSTTYGEAVCVAGVRVDTPVPEWVRLFPVKFRDLPPDRRFRKYEIIRLKACKHSTDPRAETWRPNLDTIEVLEFIDSKRHWSERRARVEPLVGPTMCELHRRRKGGGPGASLGLIRPRSIRGIRVTAEDAWTQGQLGTVGQGNLLTNKTELVKPGHAFAYSYVCEEPSCGGHVQKIVDWELGEAYRSWAHTGEELIEAIRHKWLAELCGDDRVPMFFVGDQHRRPGQFLVLGTWSPIRPPDEGQLAFPIAA